MKWFAGILLASTVAVILYGQDRIPTISVDVDRVLVYATVTDEMGHYVVGLEPSNFQLSEDKVEQKVETFMSEDVPLSVGIVLDISGSMQSILPLAKDAAVMFLKSSNPADEYFLVEVNDRAKEILPFTSDITKLQNHMVFLAARGNTALFDGVYLALQRVKQGQNPRKLLLVITDGGENHSRYTYSQLRDSAREQDIQVYRIGPAGMDVRILTSGNPPSAEIGSVDKIVESTGGRTFMAQSPNDLDDICTKIAIEVKNQYVISYRPSNTTHDGKYRNIRLKVIPPKGLPQLFVHAKQGYYAPQGPSPTVDPQPRPPEHPANRLPIN